jgi:hypothetical protein
VLDVFIFGLGLFPPTQNSDCAAVTEERTQANNYPVPNLGPSAGRSHVAAYLEPENVDHEGLPQLPARSGPDWGEVGGLAAVAFARKRFGGAYMDASRGLCIGIDGVTLDHCTASGSKVSVVMRSLMGSDSLPLAWNQSFSVVLRVEGLSESENEGRAWQLSVSGHDWGSFSTTQMHHGVNIFV